MRNFLPDEHRGWRDNVIVRFGLVGLAAVLVLGVLGAVFGLGDDPPEAPAAAEADASALTACREFRGVINEVQARILTDAEVRSRLRDVYDRARVSDRSAVASGAEGMLAAATAGDSEEFLRQAAGMDAACRTVEASSG